MDDFWECVDHALRHAVEAMNRDTLDLFALSQRLEGTVGAVPLDAPLVSEFEAEGPVLS